MRSMPGPFTAASSPDQETKETDVLFPLFHYERSAGIESYHVFPLLGVDASTLENREFDLRVLWPLFKYHSRLYRDTDDWEARWRILPILFYGNEEIRASGTARCCSRFTTRISAGTQREELQVLLPDHGHDPTVWTRSALYDLYVPLAVAI